MGPSHITHPEPPKDSGLTPLGHIHGPHPPARHWHQNGQLRGGDRCGGPRHGTGPRGLCWWLVRGQGRHPRQVQWFYVKITPEKHPWAYQKGHPRLCIAALELYGTLLLYRHIVGTERDLLGPINLTLALQTDNKGNAYQATMQPQGSQ